MQGGGADDPHLWAGQHQQPDPRPACEVVGYAIDQIGASTASRNGLLPSIHAASWRTMRNDREQSGSRTADAAACGVEAARSALVRQAAGGSRTYKNADVRRQGRRRDRVAGDHRRRGRDRIHNDEEDRTDTRSIDTCTAAWVKLTVLAIERPAGGLTLDRTNVRSGRTGSSTTAAPECLRSGRTTRSTSRSTCLQKDLKMDARRLHRRQFGDKTLDGVLPARCNEMQIGLKAGLWTIDQAAGAVESVVRSIERKYMVVSADDPLRRRDLGEAAGDVSQRDREGKGAADVSSSASSASWRSS